MMKGIRLMLMLLMPVWLSAVSTQKTPTVLISTRETFVIYEEPGLDGVHIVNAQVGSDPVTGRPVINFTLDREGGEIFYPADFFTCR